MNQNKFYYYYAHNNKNKNESTGFFFFLFLIPTFINTKSVKTGVFTEPCVRQLKQY